MTLPKQTYFSTEEVYCNACGRKFHRYTKKVSHKGMKGDIRRINSVTCSKKCSLEYHHFSKGETK